MSPALSRGCAVEGCDNPGRLKRGWCPRHYQRWQKYGDPEYPPQHLGWKFRPVVNGAMRCSRCKRMRPVESFQMNKKQGHRTSWCRTCRAAYLADFRRENPRTEEKYRTATYARRYGLFLKQYEDLFDAQRGRCGICNQIPERRLHVDHDHATGKVRGLLCGNCNRGLGMFQHDADAMRAAIEWLQRGSEVQGDGSSSEQRSA